MHVLVLGGTELSGKFNPRIARSLAFSPRLRTFTTEVTGRYFLQFQRPYCEKGAHK